LFLTITLFKRAGFAHPKKGNMMRQSIAQPNYPSSCRTSWIRLLTGFKVFLIDVLYGLLMLIPMLAAPLGWVND
jgi:hypothetical protein